MVSHGYEHVEAQREAQGIPTRRWYKCHGCGAEYTIDTSIRNSVGCSNSACVNPNIHIHSDLDGEQPITL